MATNDGAGMNVIKTLELTEAQMKVQPVGLGRFCRVLYDKWLDKFLAKRFGRKGLCLKVLRYIGDVWEGAPLEQVVKLQNIAALRGMAPRVYAIVKLPDGMLAQVTDWTPPGVEPTLEGIEKLARFLREIGAQTAKRIAPNGPAKWDIVTSTSNWCGDRFLDWGGMTLADQQNYEEGLRARVMVRIERAYRGDPADHTYQALPQLNIAGARDFKHRLDATGLDKLELKGKTVLALGCNLGEFCFYADDRGARRVVGVDLPFLAQPMQEVANWLGYWNVDIVGAELPREVGTIAEATKLQGFDVVLALSICNHIGGYGRWIADLCKDMLILEGHGGDQPEKYLDDLRRDFAKVDLVGYTTDVMKRPVFVCRKGA